MSKSQITNLANHISILKQKCQEKDRILVKDFGITCPEFNCLSNFFYSNNHKVKELAERLNITPGGVTRIVTSLEQKGFLKREISSKDRRNIIVSLTTEGEKLVDQTVRASSDYYHQILKNISSEDRQKILSSLKILIAAWENNSSTT